MRLIYMLGGLCLSVSALAVVPGSLSDTNTTDYNFVGQLNGASGVLIGSNLVLTAKHVGAGDFTLPGFGTFSVVSGSAVSDPNSDLTLFRINVGSVVLPYTTIDVSPMVFGNTVTMVGYGLSGALNGNSDGYDIFGTSAGVRRKASAFYDHTEFVDEPGYLAGNSLIAPLRHNGEAALAGGDSGGGWFRNGKLVGTNAFIGRWGNFAVDFAFSTDTNNYFGSGAISMAGQVEFLRANNVAFVPEPASFAVLGLGLACLVRRRKK